MAGLGGGGGFHRLTESQNGSTSHKRLSGSCIVSLFYSLTTIATWGGGGGMALS